jgi:putative endonuclease
LQQQPLGTAVAGRQGMPTSPQRIVYILKSADQPPRYYTGVTTELGKRLEAHNAGRCSHTAKYRPWAVDVVVKFADEPRALKFEKYLKSGSGVEFARRHLR